MRMRYRNSRFTYLLSPWNASSDVSECYCRLSRSDQGLATGDYDEHVMPGEAVLLNGQSTYPVSCSTSCHKPAAPPLLTTSPIDDTTTSSMYEHGVHGCRLGWDETPTGDCPTCGDTQLACNTDDSEVCFTEELVRRKLLLGRCPPSLLAAESQYDRVPISGASAEVVMRTFKGLSPSAQSSGPCPPGTVCWTSSQTGADHDSTVERARIQ